MDRSRMSQGRFHASLQFIKKHRVYVIIVIVGLLFMIRPITLTVENNQLARSGRITRAVITSKKWESASYRNEDGYWYTFQVNGTVYTGHTFDQEQGPADTITVIYLPGRPKVNRPHAFIQDNFIK